MTNETINEKKDVAVTSDNVPTSNEIKRQRTSSTVRFSNRVQSGDAWADVDGSVYTSDNPLPLRLRRLHDRLRGVHGDIPDTGEAA